MKKITAIILAALMLLSFAACGGNKKEPTPAPATEVPATPTAEPTAEPTAGPTEEPTAEPADSYNYNQATREFTTDFIKLTAPEGYMLMDIGGIVAFASSVDENSQNAVIYMNAPIGDDAAINFSQSVEEIEAYFKEAFGGTVSDDKCCKLTVGDHPVIYYKTTVDVDDVRAYVIACYIYSGDMLTMFTAQLYDAESFEAWNSAINEMTISGEQLGSAMTAE